MIQTELYTQKVYSSFYLYKNLNGTQMAHSYFLDNKKRQ